MKLLLSIIVISVLIFSGYQAFGQQPSLGKTLSEDLKVRIDENGLAHVTHIIRGSSLNPIQVDMIAGNMSNFTVTNINGTSVEYGTVQQSPKAIIFAAPDRNMTIIKYDLTNVVTNKNGVWTWMYYDPPDTDHTDFYFPKGVDMIWSNERPAYIGDHGVRQHGNGFLLQYVINEPVTNQNVQWQDKSFTVGIRTLSGLGNYVFDQAQKTYSFDFTKSNLPIIVIMPKALLWGPYQLASNQNVTVALTLFHENATHAWIGLIPHKVVTVQITGTTAIPEFPGFVPLAIAISTVVLLRFIGKLSLL